MNQNLGGGKNVGSATLGSVTEMRLICSVVLMSRDLSTMTRSGAEPWGCAGRVV